MSIFIEKPLETLLPFVSFAIILTNTVIVSFLLPTIIRLLKKEIDLFLSYLLIMISLGSFLVYIFVCNVFVKVAPSSTVFLTFLSAIFVVSHYNLIALRKALDQGFEIRGIYKGVLIVFISLLVAQIFFNKVLVSTAFLGLAVLFFLVFYRDISPIFARKRVMVFSLFVSLLIVSVVVDFMQALNGALSSIFVFAISVVVSMALLYETISKYLSLKEKNASMISYLERLLGASKELSKILEDVGSTKVGFEKKFFSASYDVSKLVNRVMRAASELSDLRGKVASLRGNITKLLEEFDDLPELKNSLENVRKEIINNIKYVQDKCDKCRSFSEELSSDFSKISNDFYTFIQIFKEVLDLLISQRGILNNIDESISRVQKDVSLVGYISVNGIMEFEKSGNLVMVSVYREVKNLADQVHEELARAGLLIHQLVLINEDLEYLSKRILEEVYSSISIVDLISNESANLRNLLNEFSKIVSSIIEEGYDRPRELIEVLLTSKDGFIEFFNKITETNYALDNLFEHFAKISQFMNPLRNSMFLVKEAFSNIDRSIREIKESIEKLAKEIVY